MKEVYTFPKGHEGKDIIAVFSNIQVALRSTAFSKARVEIQVSPSYFHFWNKITLYILTHGNNYTKSRMTL